MPSSPPTIMTLNLADSEKVAEGAIEMAEELGIKISVAICDAGGRLVLFTRMIAAAWASVPEKKSSRRTPAFGVAAMFDAAISQSIQQTLGPDYASFATRRAWRPPSKPVSRKALKQVSASSLEMVEPGSVRTLALLCWRLRRA